MIKNPSQRFLGAGYMHVEQPHSLSVPCFVNSINKVHQKSDTKMFLKIMIIDKHSLFHFSADHVASLTHRHNIFGVIWSKCNILLCSFYAKQTCRTLRDASFMSLRVSNIKTKYYIKASRIFSDSNFTNWRGSSGLL